MNHIKIKGIEVTAADADPIIELIRDGMTAAHQHYPLSISLKKLHHIFGETSRVIAEKAIENMMETGNDN